MMRKLHRWLGTAGMVVLFYLVVSGTVLAVDELFDPGTFAERFAETLGGQGMAAGMGAAGAVAALPADQVEAMTATVLQAALAALPDAPLNALRIRLQTQGEQVQGIVTLGGTPVQTLAFDARTGAAIVMPELAGAGMGALGGMGAGEPRQLSLNAWLQRIHSGAIAGMAGQWLILIAGMALIVLSFTGIWMFFQLLGARSKRGRKEWFWR